MRLYKAIEILQSELTSLDPGEVLEWESALKLGIEALKYVINQRADWLKTVFQELPGETFD